MADNLYLSALRMQSLPFRIKEFVDYTVVDIAEKTLVQAIRDEATLRKMPKRYIDGIHSEFIQGELWIWVNFKGDKGEPLDLFFEEGTKRHFITPQTKKALSFIETGIIGVVGGIRRFSKGHWVSGIEARHIFAEGTKKGYPQFKKLLKKEIENYLEESALFG